MIICVQCNTTKLNRKVSVIIWGFVLAFILTVSVVRQLSLPKLVRVFQDVASVLKVGQQICCHRRVLVSFVACGSVFVVYDVLMFLEMQKAMRLISRKLPKVPCNFGEVHDLV